MDIKCKKILGKPCAMYKHYLSPIFGSKYHVGETYSCEQIKPRYVGPHWEIHKGIHCYSWDKTQVVETTDVFGKRNIKIYVPRKGKMRAFIGYGDVIAVECIIPRGTIYYENQYGEIVTEKLKIVREFKQEEYVLD